MFCSRCGKELQQNTVFCPYCGTKVVDIIKNDMNENTTDNPLASNTAETGEENNQTDHNINQQNNKSYNSKTYIGAKAYIVAWIIIKILEEITVWISHKPGYYSTFGNVLFIIVMIELFLLPIVPIGFELKNKRDNVIPTVLSWLAIHYVVIKLIMFITDIVRKIN